MRSWVVRYDDGRYLALCASHGQGDWYRETGVRHAYRFASKADAEMTLSSCGEPRGVAIEVREVSGVG